MTGAELLKLKKSELTSCPICGNTDVYNSEISLYFHCQHVNGSVLKVHFGSKEANGQIPVYSFNIIHSKWILYGSVQTDDLELFEETPGKRSMRVPINVKNLIIKDYTIEEFKVLMVFV